MRPLTTALLTIGLVCASVGPASAQSPSPSSTALDQPPVIIETGFRVTFPAGWVVEDIFGEWHSVSPDGSARCQLNGERSDEPIADPVAFLDRVAAIYPGFSDGGPLPVIETSEIELPAGRAIRFVADLTLDEQPDEADDGRYTTTYILFDGRTLLFLGCWALERPEDDWLSIAETIESEPAEE